MRRGESFPSDITDQTRYQRTVDEALDLSWARLSETARGAWTIAAQFEPAPATIALLKACGVDEEAMRELSRLHLIEANGTTWEMHRLVRAYGQKKGDGTEAGLCFLLGCAAHAAAFDNSIGFKSYLADRPHFDGAVTWAPDGLARHPVEFSRLLNGISAAQWSLGRYQEARGLLERALESDVHHFGEEHSSAATRRSNLAVVLQNLGDLEGARDLLQKALASALKQFGEDHVEVAALRSNLAGVLQDMGDLEGARALLQKALASDLKQSGENHWRVAVDRAILAGVLRGLGDLEGARDLFQTALASDLKQFNEDHPRIATIRSERAAPEGS
jgi:tetratricopeptide (TPR) repeat protein